MNGNTHSARSVVLHGSVPPVEVWRCIYACEIHVPRCRESFGGYSQYIVCKMAAKLGVSRRRAKNVRVPLLTNISAKMLKWPVYIYFFTPDACSVLLNMLKSLLAHTARLSYKVAGTYSEVELGDELLELFHCPVRRFARRLDTANVASQVAVHLQSTGHHGNRRAFNASNSKTSMAYGIHEHLTPAMAKTPTTPA